MDKTIGIPTTNLQVKVLRKRYVLYELGISAPTLWRWTKSKKFPQPISLGGRSVGWLQSEVNDWINARAALRSRHTTGTRGVK